MAVVGATGYTGVELLRYLLGHPRFEITVVTSEQWTGQPLSRAFPAFARLLPLELESFDPDRVAARAQGVFLALPHGTAQEVVAHLFSRGCRVVDLSADYRLREPQVYAQYYGTPHRYPRLLEQAVYGLPEIYREEIPKARIVANPGCYPTVTILALAPLVQAGWIRRDTIVVDAKSGLTGAGRRPSLLLHFPEAHETVEAYQIGTHRHRPEMEQELSALAGEAVSVRFVPHRVPMSRGILATVYVDLVSPRTQEEVVACYEAFYRDTPFVRIRREGLPSVRDVRGTNFCDLAVVQEDPTRLVIVGAIDNLGKGASGQAIQNMNLLWGLPETLGLDQPGWVA